MSIKTKPFPEISPVHEHKEKKRPEINMNEDVTAWNRHQENKLKEEFKQDQELSEQANYIEHQEEIEAHQKDVIRSGIEGTIRNLSNKPSHEWTPQESEAFNGLSPALQEHITKQNKKRFGF